jgi:hypothetical protein
MSGKQMYQKFLKFLKTLGEVWPGVIVLSTIISFIYIKLIGSPSVVINVSKNTQKIYDEITKCNLSNISSDLGNKVKLSELTKDQVLQIWLELGQNGCEYAEIKDIFLNVNPDIISYVERSLLDQARNSFYEEIKGLDWHKNKDHFLKVKNILSSLNSIYPIEYGKLEKSIYFDTEHFSGDCNNPTNQQFILVINFSYDNDKPDNQQFEDIPIKLEDYLKALNLNPINIKKYDKTCNDELCSVLIANKNSINRVGIINLSIDLKNQVSWYSVFFNRKGDVLDVYSDDRDDLFAPFRIIEIGNSIKTQLSCIK